MLYNLLALGLVAVATARRVVVDRPNRWPVDEWREVGRADPTEEITLIVALKRRNVDKLHDSLMAVSTPGNPKYGDFMTADETSAMVRPSEVSIAAVKRWLKNGNDARLIEDVYDRGDYLAIHTVIEEAEELLETQYYTYARVEENELTGEKRMRMVNRVRMNTDYSVPSALAEHVHLVTPTHRFPARSTLRLTTERAMAAPEADRVTPTYLRKLYNVGDTKAMASNNSDGIASFQYQYYSMEDLQAFWKSYNIDACKVVNVPTNVKDGHELEAELDTQYMSSMAEGVEMQVWYNGGQFENALLEWATSVYNDNTRPLLFSVSYGTTESYYGGAYINKFNEELAMLGHIGVSVLFASGDSGAGGGCVTGAFEPDYPASSIYVTAVGGVHGGTVGSTPLGEMAWIDGGGGFSNFGAQQPWQTSAVEAYLTDNANALPASNSYNASGRGYPDIAAQSEDFIIEVNGRQEAVSGTSCASPTAGGIFALLNDLRKANDMSAMGFLNPFIYSTASMDDTAFNDVTEGQNKGCSFSNGFPAEKGWDAATGWGSPDYTSLAKHVMQTGLQTKRLKRNQ